MVDDPASHRWGRVFYLDRKNPIGSLSSLRAERSNREIRDCFVVITPRNDNALAVLDSAPRERVGWRADRKGGG